MTSKACIVTLAVAWALQAAMCVRVDDAEDPGGDAAKLEEAKKKIEEEAKNIAATVAGQEAKSEEGGPPVVFAPPAPNPIVIPMKPAIIFAHEGNPLIDHIKASGILDYDRDGSGDLDASELRSLAHDFTWGHHGLESDAEVDELLSQYDKDEDHRLNKQEVINYLTGSNETMVDPQVPGEACSGWSPSAGEDKGTGGGCGKWGWQNHWCFVPKEYEGAGAATMQESEVHPGKMFAPCKVADGAEEGDPPKIMKDDSAKKAAEVAATEASLKDAAKLMNKSMSKMDPATVAANSGPAKAKADKEKAQKKQADDAERDMKLATANGAGSGEPSPNLKKAQKDMMTSAKEMAEAAKEMKNPEDAKKSAEDALKMAKAAKEATPRAELGEEKTHHEKTVDADMDEVRKSVKEAMKGKGEEGEGDGEDDAP